MLQHDLRLGYMYVTENGYHFPHDLQLFARNLILTIRP